MTKITKTETKNSKFWQGRRANKSSHTFLLGMYGTTTLNNSSATSYKVKYILILVIQFNNPTLIYPSAETRLIQKPVFFIIASN